MSYNWGEDHNTICSAVGEKIKINNVDIDCNIETVANDDAIHRNIVYLASVEKNALNTALGAGNHVEPIVQSTWEKPKNKDVTVRNQTYKILDIMVTSMGTVQLYLGNN